MNAALLSLGALLVLRAPRFGETDAKAIMAEVYQQDTSHDATLRATLDVTDKDGHTVERSGLLSTVWARSATARPSSALPIRPASWCHASFHQPAGRDRPPVDLHAGDRPCRSVAPRERSERFAGSDFTYEDIAERSLDDFTYQLLPVEDIIENHKTSKVMATPVAPERSQYKFIYYWVAQDVPCILHAEMYDQDGRKVPCMPAVCGKNPGSGRAEDGNAFVRRGHEIGFDNRSDSSEYRAGRRAVHPGGAGEEKE